MATVQQENLQSMLAPLLVGDVACATTAAFALAPFVAMIDKGIIRYASGSATLLGSLAESASELVRLRDSRPKPHEGTHGDSCSLVRCSDRGASSVDPSFSWSSGCTLRPTSLRIVCRE
jgi:hypothetical protein